MRRYDLDTNTLLPDDYATTADACEAWASALAAEGHTLCDRAAMYTRGGGRWTRWTMRRTGETWPATEWAAERCDPATPPRPRCVHCDGCGN